MSVQNQLSQFVEAHPSLFPRKGGVLIACSGGPDSVALAWAMSDVASVRGLRVHLGHVNHGLRGRHSSRDSAFVRDLGKRIGCPVHIEKRTIPKNESGNLEEKARVERYTALVRMARRHRCQILLTAHTLDDQVESVLMNLGRGAGLTGLGGMHPVRKAGKNLILARPFLDLSKKQILDFLRSKGLAYRRDQTNSDTAFLRNWIRRRLLPTWEKRVPGLKQRISVLSRLARDEQSHWARLESEAFSRLFRKEKGAYHVDFRRLREEPVPLQRRLIRRAVGSDLLTFDAVERLRNWMAAHPTNGRNFELKRGWRVERLLKSRTFRFYRGVRFPSGPPHRKKLKLGEP